MGNFLMTAIGKLGPKFLSWAGDAASTAVGFATSSAITAPMKLLTQELNEQFPFELLGVGELTTALIRGEIKKEHYLEQLKKLGINNERAELIYKISTTSMNVGDVQNLYNRALLTPEEAKIRLGKMGFSKTSQEELLTLAGFIPSVSDFVRFAVREVFNEETSKIYGIFEGQPPEFESKAKLAGLDPQYAKYYWAAHWDLPSFSQGVEMRHRDIINQKELVDLITALDVMPFWRDKLIKLSMSPYTRVDVRRMFQMNILSPGQVLTAYKDLGYDDEKAANMAKFAMTDTSSDTKEFTKAEIIACYENGLLEETECKQAIKDIGYGDIEIEFIMQLSDLKRMRSYTNKFINAIKGEFLNGRMSIGNVEVTLNELNLKADAIAEIIATWELEIIPKDAHPTKAELLKWYGARKISVQLFTSEMEYMGYNKVWIDLYKSTAKMTAREETILPWGIESP